MTPPVSWSQSHWDKFFGIDRKSDSFGRERIAPASPETIRSWSTGEVENAETIHHRTRKPEMGGLMCESIFGPMDEWQLAFDDSTRANGNGTLYESCRDEETLPPAECERMGHIELVVPVSNAWFYKSKYSRIGLFLDMAPDGLERVVCYEDYVIIDPGKTSLGPRQILNELDYTSAQEKHGRAEFCAGKGAGALRDLLSRIDLPSFIVDLEQSLRETQLEEIRQKLVMRLELAQWFYSSRTRPEWMILEVLPVIPAKLRPLVFLESGRFATSRYNDLYSRVIKRNQRLKCLLELKTPEIIILSEKRNLQWAVDALFGASDSQSQSEQSHHVPSE